MARISTHVLDTSRGAPAASVIVELRHAGELVRRATTNADGRTDEPLLADERIATGVYELTFHVGGYFRQAGVAVTEPPFLDHVVIRFGVSDPAGHYHVPLLVSPYGYSTYKGS